MARVDLNTILFFSMVRKEKKVVSVFIHCFISYSHCQIIVMAYLPFHPMK